MVSVAQSGQLHFLYNLHDFLRTAFVIAEVLCAHCCNVLMSSLPLKLIYSMVGLSDCIFVVGRLEDRKKVWPFLVPSKTKQEKIS